MHIFKSSHSLAKFVRSHDVRVSLCAYILFANDEHRALDIQFAKIIRNVRSHYNTDNANILLFAKNVMKKKTIDYYSERIFSTFVDLFLIFCKT